MLLQFPGGGGGGGGSCILVMLHPQQHPNLNTQRLHDAFSSHYRHAKHISTDLIKHRRLMQRTAACLHVKTFILMQIFIKQTCLHIKNTC